MACFYGKNVISRSNDGIREFRDKVAPVSHINS